MICRAIRFKVSKGTALLRLVGLFILENKTTLSILIILIFLCLFSSTKGFYKQSGTFVSISEPERVGETDLFSQWGNEGDKNGCISFMLHDEIVEIKCPQ